MKTPIQALRFFGLHMAEGTAEYAKKDAPPEKILVLENAIKNMNPSFEGVPICVGHVDEEVPGEEHGHVVRSFYNALDGKHWCEFLVTTQEALTAIQKGWKLSNSYTPTSKTVGGIWHGMQYDYEVTAGKANHMAIVSDPRYAESIILTPDDFKAYNDKKESDLKRLSNSLEKKQMFKIFKREKIENSLDFENTIIELPKSKKEMTLAQIVNALDAIENMHGYANVEHMVKVGEEEMSVKNLADCYSKMKSSMDEEKKKENEEDEDKENDAESEKDAGEDAKKNEEDEEKENEDAPSEGSPKEANKELVLNKKKKNSKEEFNKQKNAHIKNDKETVANSVLTTRDRVALGKKLF